MKIWVLLAVLAASLSLASADCTSFGVFSTEIGSFCLCNSGYYLLSGVCSIISPCSTPSLSSLSSGASLASTSVSATTGLIEFNVTIPAASSRQYTAINIGTCNETDLSSFGTTTVTESCTDAFSITIPVNNLTAKCGFTTSYNVNVSNTLYEVLSGNVRLQYSETVTIGLTTYERPVSVVLPALVYLQETVTVTAGQVAVHSNFSLASSISLRNLTTGMCNIRFV